MPCVLPDGSVAPVAKRVLSSAREARSAEDISKDTGLPIYRVRGSIRELMEAGLVEERGGKYQTTEAGRKKI